jgi:hypothetical protein
MIIAFRFRHFHCYAAISRFSHFRFSLTLFHYAIDIIVFDIASIISFIFALFRHEFRCAPDIYFH